MIVAGPDGLMKNAYRKFTIRGRSHRVTHRSLPRRPPLPRAGEGA